MFYQTLIWFTQIHVYYAFPNKNKIENQKLMSQERRKVRKWKKKKKKSTEMYESLAYKGTFASECLVNRRSDLEAIINNYFYRPVWT